MRTFLSTWWERLRSSYWVIPTLLAAAAVGLSALTLHIDTRINPKWARDSAWVWAGGAEGARSMLATIASSTITVAGVVFSITILTLTLASSQFGPRLLRNFMSDRGTQLVLGVFVATFLYCLLVLRAVRGTEALTIVPFLSVTGGVALALMSVGFLIYFIHHVSTAIMAENVIARVAVDLRSNIDRLFPDTLRPADTEEASHSQMTAPEGDSRPIRSPSSGFVQAIAMDGLLALAKRNDLTLHLEYRPGEFVAEGAVLAMATPRANIGEDLSDHVVSHFFFGNERTPTQDVEYSVDQLVEVAVRALSPGTNDPFTAINCIEWLGVALIRLTGRRLPSRSLRDDGGRLRVVTRDTDFQGIADAALNQVRQYGCSSVAVTIRLLNVLARVGPHVVRESDRQALVRHARAVRDDGVAEALNGSDGQAIEARFQCALIALRGA